jgi:hypothetical protein
VPLYLPTVGFGAAPRRLIHIVPQDEVPATLSLALVQPPTATGNPLHG